MQPTEKSTAGGLCTIEAVGQALGVIEGSEIQAALEDALAAMLDRIWQTRYGR